MRYVRSVSNTLIHAVLDEFRCLFAIIVSIHHAYVKTHNRNLVDSSDCLRMTDGRIYDRSKTFGSGVDKPLLRHMIRYPIPVQLLRIKHNTSLVVSGCRLRSQKIFYSSAYTLMCVTYPVRPRRSYIRFNKNYAASSPTIVCIRRADVKT